MLAFCSVNREQFRRQVKTEAEAKGWQVYDSFPDTYIGCADMILVGEKVLFVMLLDNEDVPTNEQIGWQESIAAAGCCWVAWRPGDWGEIRERIAAWCPRDWEGTKFYLADM